MADVEHWCTGRRSWHSIPGRGGTGNGTPGLLIGNAYDINRYAFHLVTAAHQTPTPPLVPSQHHRKTPEKAEEVEEVEHTNKIITVGDLIFNALML